MTIPTQGGAKKCLVPSSLSFGLDRFWKDQQGTIAIMTGLSATVLVGFAALAIDVASWQVAQRSMQGAADAAAYSAGVAYNRGDGTDFHTQAKGITAAQGYVDGQNGATVAVNRPPTLGSHTGSATAIEVIIQQPQPRFLAGLFLSSNPTVNARAVATIAGSGACILALDPTANQAITVSGSSSINSPGCDIVANSSSASAFSMSGSSTVTTSCLVVGGNASVTSGLSLTQCGSPVTGAAPTGDPYALVPQPTPSGSCLTVPNGSPVTLVAGYYCSGLHISSSQSATFGAGVYYVTGGNFQIDGTASGTGVTFFIAAPNSVTINGSRTTSFTAPTSGTYSGIVFFGDRAGSSSNNSTIDGGSNTTITGAVYFPTQSLTFAGGAATGSDCTQLVADTIKVTGSSYFNSACTGDGMAQIVVHSRSVGTVQLVE
jgi:Flp pilus assembly protein TadG